MNDRVSDLARANAPDRHHRIGCNIVSADVVRFIPRPRRNGGEPTDFPMIAFRSVALLDEPVD
jgi:hypothetical protein